MDSSRIVSARILGDKPAPVNFTSTNSTVTTFTLPAVRYDLADVIEVIMKN